MAAPLTTAALLCALTGRSDEARQWFPQARDRLTGQDAILLLPHVCCNEALREIRLGTNCDRRHALSQLDEAADGSTTSVCPASSLRRRPPRAAQDPNRNRCHQSR